MKLRKYRREASAIAAKVTANRIALKIAPARTYRVEVWSENPELKVFWFEVEYTPRFYRAAQLLIDIVEPLFDWIDSHVKAKDRWPDGQLAPESIWETEFVASPELMKKYADLHPVTYDAKKDRKEKLMREYKP